MDAGVAGQDAGVALVLLNVRGSVSLDGAPVLATVHVGKHTLSSGEDGKFSWQGGVDEGATVWAERGPLRSTAFYVVANPDLSSQVHLALGEPTRVKGRVVGLPGRQPLAGFKVTLSGTGGGSMLTDEKGEFAADHAGPGFNSFSVDGERGWQSRGKTFFLEPGKVNEVEIALDATSVVAGRVVDSSQQPVALATVHIEGVGRGKTSTLTGADGVFRFPYAAASSYLVSAWNAKGRSPLLATPPRDDLVLVLGDAASLTVSVSRQGKPATGITCRLNVGMPGVEAPEPLTTGSEGKVTFTGLAVGTWEVAARRGSRRWHVVGKQILAVGPNTLGATIEDADRQLDVTVIDHDQKGPVEGIQLNLDGDTRVTDPDGKATFDDLDPSAELSLEVKGGGYPPATESIPKEAATVTVALRRWRTLAGKAVDEKGRAIRGLSIDSNHVDTDADGRFAQDVTPAEKEFKVWFMCEDCAPKPLKVPAGTTDLDVGTVVLSRMGVLHVTVTTPDGRPARFAQVYDLPDGKKWLDLKTRENPAFLVDGLGQASVPYRAATCFVALAEGFAPSGLEGCPFEARPGETTEVKLRLRSGGFVEGSVAANGRPVVGRLIFDNEEGLNAVTDERGHYRLGPLSPGAHAVASLAVAPASQLESRFVTVTAGSTVTVDFGAEPGARVTAVWTGPDATDLFAVAAAGHIDFATLKTLKPNGNDKLKIMMLGAKREAVFESLTEGEWTVFLGPTKREWVGLLHINVVRGTDLQLKIGPPP